MTAAPRLPDPRAFLRSLFAAAVQRAQPGEVLRAHLPPPPRGRTVVVGAGKAAAAMAHAVERAWPADAPLEGVVVTRYGHVPPRSVGEAARIEVLEAAHPVPDAAGLDATRRILAAVRGLSPDDLVLCLVSGGASALLTAPAEGLDFADKQAINQALLHSGARIDEMNCVRKHLSAIKGGRLAAACAPAPVLTLAISDVPQDDVSVIGSGPTVPDPGTCADALAVLRRYRIAIPAAVRTALEQGTLETPKPGDACFERNTVRVIAAPWQSLQAAAEVARRAGVPAHILGDAIEGESQEVGKVHGAIARTVAARGLPFAPPCVLLSGGETTVTVRPATDGVRPGRGGRAGEFCLGLAQALDGDARIWALAADTDGIDGMESNAGAFVTPDTLARAAGYGLSLADSLQRHDAHGFFAALDDLLVTGPTHTNVNDFRALLIL
ncbi:MAG: glycerate kinase type-2 family protein [Ramlibacter sp.]